MKLMKGLVKWARNIRVKTSCDMDIVNFPYDVQSCPITISSQDNSNEFLKLSTRKWNRINNVKEDEIDVRPSDIDTVKVNFFRNRKFKPEVEPDVHLKEIFILRINIIRIQTPGYWRVIHIK